MEQAGKEIIWDNRGQWDHPGKITGIRSNRITMKGVPFKVRGVDNNGNEQMMYPEQEYYFPGAEYVIEYPIIETETKK
jgi:hypothetical protein